MITVEDIYIHMYMYVPCMYMHIVQNEYWCFGVHFVFLIEKLKYVWSKYKKHGFDFFLKIANIIQAL